MCPSCPSGFNGISAGVEQFNFTRRTFDYLADDGYRTFYYLPYFSDVPGIAGEKQFVVLSAPQRQFQRLLLEAGFYYFIYGYQVGSYFSPHPAGFADMRSEERRVGKE